MEAALIYDVYLTDGTTRLPLSESGASVIEFAPATAGRSDIEAVTETLTIQFEAGAWPGRKDRIASMLDLARRENRGELGRVMLVFRRPGEFEEYRTPILSSSFSPVEVNAAYLLRQCKAVYQLSYERPNWLDWPARKVAAYAYTSGSNGNYGGRVSTPNFRSISVPRRQTVAAMVDAGQVSLTATDLFVGPTNIEGNVPGPVRIHVRQDPAFSGVAANYNMGRLIAGSIDDPAWPEFSAGATLIFEAEAGSGVFFTYGATDVNAGAAGYNDASGAAEPKVKRTTFTPTPFFNSIVRFDVSQAVQSQAGDTEFKPILRFMGAPTIATPPARMRWRLSTAMSLANPAIPQTLAVSDAVEIVAGARHVELPSVKLTPFLADGTTTSGLFLEIEVATSGSSGITFDLDCLLMIPTDSFVSLLCLKRPIPQNNWLVHDARFDKPYELDASGAQLLNPQALTRKGLMLTPGVDNTITLMAGRYENPWTAISQDLAAPLQVEIYHYPRWRHLP